MNKIEQGQNPTPDYRGADPTLYSGVRGAAVKALTRVERSGAYLDKLLDAELRSPDLNAADKRLLTEITTGVLRWRDRLDWVLTGFYHGEFQKAIPIVKNAMRVALYQILYLDRVPASAAVNESVEIVKRLKGEPSARVVNAVLRNIIRKRDEITWPDKEHDLVHYLGITYSHPQWIVQRWLERFGEEEAAALMEANNTRPPLSLRVNPLRGTLEELEQALTDAGIEHERSAIAPGFLRARNIANIGENELFTAGLFTMQDEGAGLAVRLSGAKPGMRVIDLCAAPGGKSVAMAEMMESKGEVIAVDTYSAKLPLIQAAAERLGLTDMITPVTSDARTAQLEPADIVFVDAPCSGLGVLRRKPDSKWTREKKDILRLTDLQRGIMKNAARLVRPGGHLIYSTCSIELEENERMVEWFLAKHPEFELVPAGELLPPEVVTPEGYLQTFPHKHNTDGMFGARLHRKG